MTSACALAVHWCYTRTCQGALAEYEEDSERDEHEKHFGHTGPAIWREPESLFDPVHRFKIIPPDLLLQQELDVRDITQGAVCGRYRLYSGKRINT